MKNVRLSYVPILNLVYPDRLAGSDRLDASRPAISKRDQEAQAPSPMLPRPPLSQVNLYLCGTTILFGKMAGSACQAIHVARREQSHASLLHT
jgi:hypothetical protein